MRRKEEDEKLYEACLNGNKKAKRTQENFLEQQKNRNKNNSHENFLDDEEFLRGE